MSVQETSVQEMSARDECAGDELVEEAGGERCSVKPGGQLVNACKATPFLSLLFFFFLAKWFSYLFIHLFFSKLLQDGA